VSAEHTVPSSPKSSAITAPFADLAGRRIVVTGAASGIGRAIALGLAEVGASVVVHTRSNLEGAERVLAAMNSPTGPRSALHMADLSDPDACRRLVSEVWSAGPVDAWVNNAGADVLTGEARHWSFERKLEQLHAVDLRGTMLLSRDVGSRMRARGRGAILNIGWDQAATGMDGDSGELFAAIKGGVMAFTRSLAVSLAPTVRVNCIAPGWIRTAWGEHAPAEWQARVLRETPLARWGEPEDIARLARFLLSDDAAYLTGQVWNANGGAIR
jgi:3-oxoacyl-[acyl-carrier protein] reductase